MALRASLGALRRVSASVVAPLVKRKTFVLPSARRALAAPPVWTPRAGSMSTVSDSQQKEKPEKQQKEKPEPQQKEPFKITFDFIKVVSTVVGLAGTAYVMWTYSPKVVSGKVLQTFESGGKPGWDEGFGKDADAVVKRPDVEKKLKELFYPNSRVGGDLDASYVLIVGELGTGKSTAVRRVVREHEGINGAIYVNVPDDIRFFGGVVASAVGMPDITVDIDSGIIRRINQETKEVRDLPLSEEPSATWARASVVIRGAAIKFRRKHKRPAVLIIDGAELFAQENPAFLQQLQLFAKQRTDEGCLRVVFVSSDGSVLEQFQSRSAKSRMRKPPFEVGDVSDKEAVEFLKGEGVAEKQAEEAVRDITGGRFELLNDYLRVSADNDARRKDLFKATRDAVWSVGIRERHPLFGALVAQQRIDKSPACLLLGAKADTTLRALLDKNIIAAHPDLTFTFHSRHVESFFKQEVLGSKRWWWWW